MAHMVRRVRLDLKQRPDVEVGEARNENNRLRTTTIGSLPVVEAMAEVGMVERHRLVHLRWSNGFRERGVNEIGTRTRQRRVLMSEADDTADRIKRIVRVVVVIRSQEGQRAEVKDRREEERARILRGIYRRIYVRPVDQRRRHRHRTRSSSQVGTIRIDSKGHRCRENENVIPEIEVEDRRGMETVGEAILRGVMEEGGVVARVGMRRETMVGIGTAEEEGVIREMDRNIVGVTIEPTSGNAYCSHSLVFAVWSC